MPSDDRYSSLSNGTQPTITRTVTKSVVPVGPNDLIDSDVVVTKKHEEWTTSKRVVNHKTKQVETRVQRQLVLEDGRVVADSGPQVTTKTKEDVRVEESENTEHKTTGDDPPGPEYTLVPGSARVISEKTESNQTMTETKEENRQMHDENIRELSGEEIHQRTIISPDDPSFVRSFGEFPGKLTHFSSRSQKIVDKDEVKEISELKDGEISTETTRTHHHEEAYDDEVPEEEAEEGMVPERSAETSRTIQYYTDPREFEAASERLQAESRRSHLQNHPQPIRSTNPQRELPAVAHRWVDDHFGNSSDMRGECTRTKSGGNRITIEMSGHRSSPSDFSPRDKTHDRSRDSTLRNNRSSTGWRSPSPPYTSSTPLQRRSTASPFEVSSSSGSSRSKTPVKTFYLGQDNTYQRDWKKKSNQSLASTLSTNSLGRSNLSGHYGERSDSFTRVPRSRLVDPMRYKTDKNVQASLSDDDNDGDLKRGRRSPRTLTLPRVVKVTHESSSSRPYSSHSLSKQYKSSDSLHSPSYGNYYDYSNSTRTFRNSSPVYNNSTFHRKSEWNGSAYTNSYDKKSSYLTNGRKSKTPTWYGKGPTSPPESGYQSPFPPTPPSSPPPRFIDHYGSSSSISPPDSPRMTTASIKKKSTFPSGSSRSKSSGDLRSAPLFNPQSFSPLSSPLELKTVGERSDRQKYFRVKPGQDGQSVVVQVRDWQGR